MANRQECDVVVVGGGPAGSTIAALLAQKRHHVVVLEKERFPRFHVGESLLPLNLPLFERLGVADDVRRIGVYKPGAELISDAHQAAATFRFCDNRYLRVGHSYQVRRSDFDKLLLDNSRRLGAQVLEGTRVTDVALAPGIARVSPRPARTEHRHNGLRDFSSTPRGETPCSPAGSALSASTSATTPRPCSDISAMFRAGPATKPG